MDSMYPLKPLLTPLIIFHLSPIAGKLVSVVLLFFYGNKSSYFHANEETEYLENKKNMLYGITNAAQTYVFTSFMNTF